MHNSTKLVLFFSLVGLLGIGWFAYRQIYGDRTDQLFSAIDQDDVKKVEQLIKKGADVNGVRGMKVGRTSLEKAIRTGNHEVVALLLRNGARVTKVQDWMQYPLDIAIAILAPSQKKIIRLLMEYNAPTTASKIIPAILSDNMELVKELTESAQKELQEGTLKKEELERETIFSGNKEIFNYVITNILHADPKKKRSDLLKYAIESNNQDFIDYIFSLPQTDINATNDQGLDLLLKAIIHSNVRIVKKLLEMGANPNAQDDRGNTPLHEAIRWRYRRNEEIIKLLLNYGADPTIRNKAGKTADELAQESEKKK